MFNICENLLMLYIYIHMYICIYIYIVYEIRLHRQSLSLSQVCHEVSTSLHPRRLAYTSSMSKVQFAYPLNPKPKP